MSDGATLQSMRDTLIPIANAAWIGRCATLAGWILLLYDWVISFEREVSQSGLDMELHSSKNLFTGQLDMGEPHKVFV